MPTRGGSGSNSPRDRRGGTAWSDGPPRSRCAEGRAGRTRGGGGRQPRVDLPAVESESAGGRSHPPERPARGQADGGGPPKTDHDCLSVSARRHFEKVFFPPTGPTWAGERASFMPAVTPLSLGKHFSRIFNPDTLARESFPTYPMVPVCQHPPSPGLNLGRPKIPIAWEPGPGNEPREPGLALGFYNNIHFHPKKPFSVPPDP